MTRNLNKITKNGIIMLSIVIHAIYTMRCKTKEIETGGTQKWQKEDANIGQLSC